MLRIVTAYIFVNLEPLFISNIQFFNHKYHSLEKSLRLCYNTHIKDGIKQPGNKTLFVVTSAAERLKLLELCHSSGTAAHNSLNVTMERLTSAHYWRGMKADAQAFVSKKMF